MQVDGVFGHETFEERVQSGVVVADGGELRIQFGNVGTDAAVQDLLAVAALDN
jgi:hypothetical protein